MHQQAAAGVGDARLCGRGIRNCGVPDAAQRATLLRSAGTQTMNTVACGKSLCIDMGHGSAARRFALRCIRGRRASYARLFARIKSANRLNR